MVQTTPRKVGRLNTVNEVRREMARVYREARQGEIKITDGSKFVYMLQVIGQTIRDTDLEKRIEALENGS